MPKTRTEIQRDYEKRSNYAAKKKYEEKIIKVQVYLNKEKDHDIINNLDFSKPLATQIVALAKSGVINITTQKQPN